ncbi:dynein axonemal heavy chain 7 isoform X1 [Bemisia tabaci]|uniref:dynein axonemal heavy chain 7 isoform X1 n=1 Tax=Bemisia tabaci TaxID=7038 RepID=UPI003B27FF74
MNTYLHFFHQFFPRFLKVISYIELKEEREKFRKQIIKVIVSRDTEYNDETIIPSSDEIQLVRYNYYIQHGIDTVHVAPIEQHWISHILDLVPISLKKKHVKEVNAIFLEVKEDFQVAIKKGIVDFVLDDFKFMMQDSISKNDGKQLESFNKSARIEFDQAKQVISKNLFISNPVMVYLHQLWHKQFRNNPFCSLNELKGFELPDFMLNKVRACLSYSNPISIDDNENPLEINATLNLAIDYITSMTPPFCSLDSEMSTTGVESFNLLEPLPQSTWDSSLTSSGSPLADSHSTLSALLSGQMIAALNN